MILRIVIVIMIRPSWGHCIFTIKMLIFSGESAGKVMRENGLNCPAHFFGPREFGLFWHANLHAGTLTRLSTRHLPAQNLEKTAVKNRRCVFTIKIGALHNYDNYCTGRSGGAEINDSRLLDTAAPILPSYTSAAVLLSIIGS